MKWSKEKKMKKCIPSHVHPVHILKLIQNHSVFVIYHLSIFTIIYSCEVQALSWENAEMIEECFPTSPPSCSVRALITPPPLWLTLNLKCQWYVRKGSSQVWWEMTKCNNSGTHSSHHHLVLKRSISSWLYPRILWVFSMLKLNKSLDERIASAVNQH